MGWAKFTATISFHRYDSANMHYSILYTKIFIITVPVILREIQLKLWSPYFAMCTIAVFLLIAPTLKVRWEIFVTFYFVYSIVVLIKIIMTQLSLI